MANMGLTVEVKPVLTVDTETAYVCLGLLEMYCRQNKKTIEVRHTRPADSDEEFKVAFDFKDDDRFAEQIGGEQ